MNTLVSREALLSLRIFTPDSVAGLCILSERMSSSNDKWNGLGSLGGETSARAGDLMREVMAVSVWLRRIGAGEFSSRMGWIPSRRDGADDF